MGTGGRIMSQVASIDTSAVHPALKEARFTIACDVRNPFCGSDGAAYVFASQKGADAKMVKELDTGMQALSRVILSTTGKDISDIPGAGAAGGMGGGFLAFLNAELKPGIRLMLDVLDFGKRITGADLIFTGEGRADRQTVMGKVPSGILEEARKQNIPVIVLAGSIEDAAQMNRAGFQGNILDHTRSSHNGESDGTGICERKYPQAGDSDLFGNPPVRHALKQEKYVHGISTLRTIVGLH